MDDDGTNLLRDESTPLYENGRAVRSGWAEKLDLDSIMLDPEIAFHPYWRGFFSRPSALIFP